MRDVATLMIQASLVLGKLSLVSYAEVGKLKCLKLGSCRDEFWRCGQLNPQQPNTAVQPNKLWMNGLNGRTQRLSKRWTGRLLLSR